MKPICFATGNEHKIREFTSAFYNTKEFVTYAFDLPELYGTPEEVAEAKCKRAAELYQGPVITEDVSLCLACFNYQLPGVYVKDFLKAIGFDGLVKMVSPFDDKTGYSQCIYAYCEGPGSEVRLFKGRCQGKIVESKGTGNFGKAAFDTIFMADCNGKRFSEMSVQEKNDVSHRGLAIKQLKQFFDQQ